MLALNGHAKHRQSLCRVGYGKTALSMDLFFITPANILSTHTFLLLSPFYLYSVIFSLSKIHDIKKRPLFEESFIIIL